MKHAPFLSFIVLIGIAAVLRFANLNWGAPFYFHPDERNIASAISELSFPNNFNPHFFAYGSLPMYIIYLTGVILHFLPFTQTATPLQISFSEAIIISRFYSALFSLLLIPLLFIIGKRLKNTMAGIWAAFFATFSVGLLQFSHFGTFEMWLSFFGALFFLFHIVLYKHFSFRFLIGYGVVLGILIGIKISSLVFLVFPFLLLGTVFLQQKKPNSFINSFSKLFLVYVVALGIFLISNPFVLFNFASFQDTIRYESSVGIGSLPVFYTQGFFGTIPIIFQFKSIYPFLLSPLLTILFFISFVWMLYKSVKEKNAVFIFLLVFFLVVFLPQAVLFVKWTRYIVPTLPFIFLCLAVFLTSINLSGHKHLNKTLPFLLICNSIIYGFLYFSVVTTAEDSRIAATSWAHSNMPQNAHIVSEIYDMGITPFNTYFSNITLFNTYDLDMPGSKKDTMLLEQAEYIILPSQRIFRSRIQNKKQFPNGYVFYEMLLSNKFKKIYQTPCDMRCKFLYNGDPIFANEETITVFDRPILIIFQKT